MSPREKKNSVQIRVFVSPEVYAEMQKDADKKGTTISGLTRMVLNEKYLKGEENGKGED